MRWRAWRRPPDLHLFLKMIGAALVFDNPAVFGLPRARGILTPVDAMCIDASERPC
jgi:hypothetical protein